MVSSTLALFVGIGNTILIHTLFLKGYLPLAFARFWGRLAFLPTLPASIAIYMFKGQPWWSRLDEHVYLGALPLTALGHVDELYRLGVRGVVNLCDEYDGPVHAYAEKGIEQLHVPVVDHTEPPAADIARSLRFIAERVSRGQAVYIHCKAGHGRSAAVAFCWLMSTKSLTLPQTQEYINRLRNVRKGLYMQPNVNKLYAELQSGNFSPWQNLDKIVAS
eukprot:TRINITY_DN19940_c0_g1_i1.p2 TRINITY_DN19940_c0_g1~~TRINITY_DN19940_c0_g1_i1.p2  ORF type:complete len:230 (+),score=46.30 TRINITY_DN19940_c0_g1_i1:36-692(+)